MLLSVSRNGELETSASGMTTPAPLSRLCRSMTPAASHRIPNGSLTASCAGRCGCLPLTRRSRPRTHLGNGTVPMKPLHLHRNREQPIKHSPTRKAPFMMFFDHGYRGGESARCKSVDDVWSTPLAPHNPLPASSDRKPLEVSMGDQDYRGLTLGQERMTVCHIPPQ